MILIVPTYPTKHARHSAKDLTRHVARKILLACFAVVLFLVSGAGFAYHDLMSQLNRIDVNDMLGSDRPTRAEPATDNYEGQAVNVLILGSDTRSGANNVDNSEGSEDVAVARSDTAMVLHMSADRSRIDVVSIPRDTLVSIPECTTADGQTEPAMEDTQFNAAFANGAGTGSDAAAVGAGVACTIKTVEALTQVRIDEWMVVDFNGLSTMVNALGGVPVYVSEDIDDADYTGLVLEAGCHTMDGTMALQYSRVRHGVGDGSDISRIARQQNLMSAMLRTAQSKNLLTNAGELYSFLRSALAALTVSETLSLSTLTGLAQSVQAIGMENVNFITMPNEPASWDANRVVPSAQAEAVWTALREDTPVPEESVTVSADGSTPAATDPAATDPAATAQEAPTTQEQAPATVPSAAATTSDPAAQCR